MLVARVPVYGKLRFLDRTGQPAEKGINVGDEWTYRSFIDGRNPGRGHLDFRGSHGRPIPQRAARRNDHRGVPHATRAISKRACRAA